MKVNAIFGPPSDDPRTESDENESTSSDEDEFFDINPEPEEIVTTETVPEIIFTDPEPKIITPPIAPSAGDIADINLPPDPDPEIDDKLSEKIPSE
ncbi:hypothetical protein AYI69_g3252 [Smittium culicis]|uniref:Uncharacterized protein n=1 Tax=Smittium culicis TaxID=133412 RepID=A0A1R1YK67_9FUNG|nr:hypothetical protein AYI69_g3252 [Smittium culicis]